MHGRIYEPRGSCSHDTKCITEGRCVRLTDLPLSRPRAFMCLRHDGTTRRRRGASAPCQRTARGRLQRHVRLPCVRTSHVRSVDAYTLALPASRAETRQTAQPSPWRSRERAPAKPRHARENETSDVVATWDNSTTRCSGAALAAGHFSSCDCEVGSTNYSSRDVNLTSVA
jgi:hypothetical protein